MTERSRLRDHLENLPLRLIDALTAPLSPRARGKVAAWLGRRIILNVPPLRRRIRSNLDLIFPDMPGARKTALMRANAGNIARTLLEMRDTQALLDRAGEIPIEGDEGLDALEAARAEGRGALIVSGHFGQWEAVRVALKARGMEAGGIYREHNNRVFNADMLPNFRTGGEPLFPKGTRGMRALIRHLASGGFAAIMMDQKTWDGEILDFMGQPATSTTAMAELALRYKLPLVPAYGIREPDGVSFRVVLEPPIPHTDARTMTQAINDSLAAQVRARPDQWYWLHRRWDTTRREDLER